MCVFIIPTADWQSSDHLPVARLANRIASWGKVCLRALGPYSGQAADPDLVVRAGAPARVHQEGCAWQLVQICKPASLEGDHRAPDSHPGESSSARAGSLLWPGCADPGRAAIAGAPVRAPQEGHAWQCAQSIRSCRL